MMTSVWRLGFVMHQGTKTLHRTQNEVSRGEVMEICGHSSDKAQDGVERKVNAH